MQITFDEKRSENASIDDNKPENTNKITLYEYEYLTKNTIRNIFYTNKEYEMIEKFVSFANDKTKYKWKSIHSNDSIDSFEGEYVQSGDNSSGICIARGTVIINCNPEDVFFGYDDYTKIKDLDENCLDVELKHKYDDHRRIMSGSFKAPFPFRSREFLFKEIRSLIDNKGNIINNLEIFNIENKFKMKGRSSVCLGFSIKSDECPFEDIIRNKHVRCNLKFGGYYFQSIGNNKCRAIYLVCMDLGGWIPAWFTNVILPQQSKNILKMKDYIDNALQKMKNNHIEIRK
eukprot:172620_1